MTPRTDADERLMTRLREADPAPLVLDRRAAVDERGEADLRRILAGGGVVAAGHVPPRSREPRRRLVLAAAAAVVVAVGVQTRQGGDDVPPAAAADQAPAPDAQALLDAVRRDGAVQYDDDVAATPSELAASAELVAMGTVVGSAPEGPAADCDGPGVLGTGVSGALLRIGDLQVAKGQPSGTTVEVAVPLGGEDALQAALPLGTRVLVFAGPGLAADCSSAQRVAGPQGLAVQAADGQVVWPMLGEVRSGELSQALPGGTLIAP